MFQKSKNTNEITEAKLTMSFKQSQLEKYETEFNNRVSTEIENLVNSLKTIIELCQVREKNKFQIFQEGYQIQTKVATLVKSAESLLTITANLKKAYLVNDSKYQIETTSNRNNEIARLKNNTKEAVSELSKQLGSAVTELNAVYLK